MFSVKKELNCLILFHMTFMLQMGLFRLWIYVIQVRRSDVRWNQVFLFK
jgi:hypothetical protein